MFFYYKLDHLPPSLSPSLQQNKFKKKTINLLLRSLYQSKTNDQQAIQREKRQKN